MDWRIKIHQELVEVTKLAWQMQSALADASGDEILLEITANTAHLHDRAMAILRIVQSRATNFGKVEKK